MTHKKTKILWLTGAWSFDTDKEIVPFLIQNYSFDIDWWVLMDDKNSVDIGKYKVKAFYINCRGKNPKRIAIYWQFFKECRLNDADIIYSDELGVPFYYPTMLIFKKKIDTIIHAAHNVIPYPVWPLSLRLYVKYVFRFNRHFQLFSKFTAEYFAKKYPKKSFFYAPMTMKNFGEVRTNNYHFNNGKVNLLFFGNIVGNKRLDLLIESMKRLPEEIKMKVHLNICGNCRADTKKYQQMIGDTTYISTYFKRIPDEEIPELFTKSQFLVLPYEDVAQSGPHMIAYNYNLPVIASDIDGFKERVVNGENGFLFKRNNIESLIKTIVKVTKLSSDEYQLLKERLRDYTETNFSVKSVAEKYIAYFKTIS